MSNEDVGKTGGKVRFSLVDFDGLWIKSDGLSGSLGFAVKHESTCGPDNPLIQAIQAMRRGEPLKSSEAVEVRSFAVAWLLAADSGVGLSEVILFSTDVPQSIRALDRVGIFGRTLKATASAGLKLAGTILLINTIWETAGAFAVDMAAATPVEVGDLLIAELKAEVAEGVIYLPDKIERELDKKFGSPGTKRPVSTLDVEAIVAFTRFAQMLPVIQRTEAAPDLVAALVHRMQQRIFTSFLVVSRQIEGVALNGISATPAVVCAHAALALGLSELDHRGEILDDLRNAVNHLPKGTRREEAARTLAALEKNVNEESTSLARSLSRNSAAAATTELADLSLMPVGLTFKFVGTVAGGLASLMEGTVLAPALKGIKTGVEGVANVSDATPSAIARLFQAGIYTEATVRGGTQAVTNYVSESIGKAFNVFRNKESTGKEAKNDDQASK